MMTRDDLLTRYFNIDMSGNSLEETFDYYRRVNPEMITNKKSSEFEYIMDVLLPTWRDDDKELFELRHVEKREDELCICSQEISDICVFVHPSIPKGLQVGNACVEKISLLLRKKAEVAQRKLKKKREEEFVKRQLKERDELVKRVEQDHDEYVAYMSKVKQRIAQLEIMFDLFRPCQVCHALAVLKDAPPHFTKCRTCYKNPIESV